MRSTQSPISLHFGAFSPLAVAALRGALDAVFPKRCKGCAAFLPLEAAEGFCSGCWATLRLIHPPYCPLCGWPYLYAEMAGHICVECLLRPPSFLRARSWVCYPRHGGEWHPLRQAIYRFKYGRKASYGKVLGRLMAEGCRPRFSRADLVIPVPLHVARLRWRGFNQAVILGQAVSRSWGVPLDAFVLRKARPTRLQTELPRKERRTNVRGAFTVHPKRCVKGQRVLLVDDIYTSGATVDECTRVLLRAGARSVQVLTLGRTV